jgi:hypothetical protein
VSNSGQIVSAITAALARQASPLGVCDTLCLKNGPWAANSAYEFNLVLIAARSRLSTAAPVTCRSTGRWASTTPAPDGRSAPSPSAPPPPR